MKQFDLSKLVVSEIKDVYNFTLSEDCYGRSKTSNNVLIIKRSGRSVYQIGEQNYTADQNTVLFIPKSTEYYFEVEKKGACLVIEFDTCPSQEELFCSEYFFNNTRDIISTAKNILQYWTLKGPSYEAKCLSEMYSIITQIATMQSYSNTLAGKYRIIHKSVKYIEANYADQDLYTPQLAEMSEIGETYYRNIFIAVFNMPPAKYIQLFRVNKAKELLAATDKPIDDIATAVGFANSSYFCKVFKSVTGKTPLEFAEKAKLIG